MISRLDCKPEWVSLQEHSRKATNRRIDGLFCQDPERFRKFSAEAAGIFLDYSKHNLDDYTLKLLLDLACASDLKGWRAQQFRGDRINKTEGEAVLHTAFRAISSEAAKTRLPALKQQKTEHILKQMAAFVTEVRSGEWCGHTGRPIRTVVHIGIGGSHIGPAMVCQALSTPATKGPEVRFVSNLDSGSFREALRAAEPETTLFVLASKSFSTPETLINAEKARQWLGLSPGRDERAVAHWVAVTGNPDRAMAYGIHPDNIFPLPGWIGGRFSLWSAMGLPIALQTGVSKFHQLLQGGHAMDQHFLSAPFAENLPILMAMAGIWCRNFLGSSSQAIVPYTQKLELLPLFLQQMEMESNGKRVTWYGEEVSWDTCPVIWGGAGTNVQHTFFQQLHQGTEVVPVDFVVVNQDLDTPAEMHRLLVANAIAQSRALMAGRDPESLWEDGLRDETNRMTAGRLVPHLVCPGNRPSSMIVLESLTPETLGALIALYEHKVFVQGVVWQICSYDQWGVEMGKKLSTDFVRVLAGETSNMQLDGSTQGLLSRLGEFARR